MLGAVNHSKVWHFSVHVLLRFAEYDLLCSHCLMHHLENLLGLLFIFWGSLNIKQIQVLANAFLNMKKARDPAGILYISLRHVPGIECPADLRYQSHALLVICSDLKPSNFRASYSYRVNSGPFFP
jgi:SAM-dependent methyltransferase